MYKKVKLSDGKVMILDKHDNLVARCMNDRAADQVMAALKRDLILMKKFKNNGR